MFTKLCTSVVFVFFVSVGFGGKAGGDSIDKIVAAIRDADYRGDLNALERLYKQTDPFVKDAKIASRVLYWRGFAKWRKAINGVNDKIDPKVLEVDALAAVREFEASESADPDYVEAKIGHLGSLGLYAFFNAGDQEKLKPFYATLQRLMADIRQASPENPRYSWVIGPALWNQPPGKGGGQEAAIALYMKAIEACRKVSTVAKGALEPTWGEPELLMNVAWSQLNREKPDLAAAEKYAKEALRLVPDWHYVKDILLPQIKSRKGK